MINNIIPKVLAIHDLSGVGRCSLSVILPILSCMGVQVCPIPTAILSTHTGDLGDFQFRDLTDFIIPTFNHYQDLKLTFDCVYTGFLGSISQIDLCCNILRSSNNSLKVVDPVMGDNGHLYRIFNSDMKDKMVKLAKLADIITPNLTEACILINVEYPTNPISTLEAKRYLLELSSLYSNYVIITGVRFSDGTMANIGYDRANNSFWRVNYDYVPVSYPGTGDIYSSIIVGSFIEGYNLPISMAKATTFLEIAIKKTYRYSSDPRYGVLIESSLGWFTQKQCIKEFANL